VRWASATRDPSCVTDPTSDPEPPPRFGPPRRVSVVIPVRNGARVISRQLDALAAQTYPGDWEIVVADNGSTDGTAKVVHDWADQPVQPGQARRPDLRVVDASTWPGVGPARNVGTRAATGDAILYCDADDRCSPGWVACMVAALGEHPIVGGPCSVEADDGSVHPPPTRLHLTLGLVPFPIGGNFGLWLDVFEAVGGFEDENPAAKAEDAEFCLRGWELGYEAGFAPGALMTKARRPDLASTYHQWHGYGMGTMFNVCRYRDRGLPRQLVRQELRIMGWMIVHLAQIRTADGRYRWTRWVAGRIGYLEGYLRFHRLPVAPRPAGARPLLPTGDHRTSMS
jgi:glycosyltransferase involved in cell wall biosynthesis